MPYGKLFMDGCCIGTISSVGTLTATSTYYSPIHIKDVNILAKNKVVEVTFYGGDKQKAVCDEKDTFDLETAISICITKHLLGGTKAYNDAVALFGTDLKTAGMNTIVGYVYDTLYSIGGGYPSYASAAAIILFVIVLTITCINLLISKKHVHY